MTQNQKKNYITPNQLTLIRIFLVPFMIFFYLADFIPYGKLIAVIIFALAAITDFFDGKLARKTGQVTDLGKFLDPIADKILILGALVLLLTDAMIVAEWGIYATIIAFIILGREFLVTGLRQLAASKGFIMSADNWGKYKAFFQDLALPAFMLLSFFNQYSILSEAGLSAFEYICFVLIITATLLTIISGVNYFIKNKYVFSKTEAEIKEEIKPIKQKIEKSNQKKTQSKKTEKLNQKETQNNKQNNKIVKPSGNENKNNKTVKSNENKSKKVGKSSEKTKTDSVKSVKAKKTNSKSTKTLKSKK